MKILQVCNKSPYPSKDGGSIAIAAISQGFSDLGHQVYILAINTPKHYVSSNQANQYLPLNSFLQLVPVDSRVKPFELIRNFLFSTKPFHIERFYSKIFETELIKVLQENEFDVVLIEGLYVTSYIKAIRKYSKAKIGYRAHNIESEIWKRIALNEKGILKKYYFNNLANRLKKYESQILIDYTFVLPITKRDGSVLKELGNSKPSFVTPAGVKTNLIVNSNQVKYPSVCYIGALDWIPNQEGLLWFIDFVWPSVIKSNNDLRLYIAGRNAPPWLVDQFKIDNVSFLGEVDDSFQFLNNYAIMIVPLFSGSGMRVKIIEGLYLGKAIVSTSIGAEGIDVVNRENIIISDTVTDFSESILELATQKDFYNKICQNARNVVFTKYNNEKIISDLVEFIEKLRNDN